jgi:hypothetical protein
MMHFRYEPMTLLMVSLREIREQLYVLMMAEIADWRGLIFVATPV